MKTQFEKIKELFFTYWKKIKENDFLKKNKEYIKYFGVFLLTVLILITCLPVIKSNDYLNPNTLTFKNPKTVEMLNIIILYHYVMSFLVGIIIFTFIFILLSLFRSYPLFYFKPRKKLDFYIEDEWLSFFINYKKSLEEYFTEKKKEYMIFYMKDIKQAIKDQITHAPLLEFLWVILPAIILIFIAYPSVMMLYYNEMFVTPLYNITALGNQWYWTYEYNDFNMHMIIRRMFRVIGHSLFISDLKEGAGSILELANILQKSFLGFQTLIDVDYDNTLKDLPEKLLVDSNLIEAKDPKFLRLLSTDQCLVIPSKTPIRVLVTSADVIHSWAVPSYGVKMDAVPGRINQQLLNIPLTGTSWGQCSELCGVNHAFMPIEIKVLSLGDFLFYIELKLKEVVFPFILNYYKVRLNILINFVNFLRENIDKPEVESIVRDKNTLAEVLNSVNILKSTGGKV